MSSKGVYIFLRLLNFMFITVYYDTIKHTRAEEYSVKEKGYFELKICFLNDKELCNQIM